MRGNRFLFVLVALALGGCAARQPTALVMPAAPMKKPTPVVRNFDGRLPFVTVTPEQYFRRLAAGDAATVSTQSMARESFGSTEVTISAKDATVHSFGDSAAVYCARECVTLSAYGYAAWTVNAQPGSESCECHLKYGSLVSGSIKVTTASPDLLQVKAIIMRFRDRGR